ncbi:hypothetical protein [Lysobacter sp. Root690]|uniref:hypothetical protein n=1 Tax=Lysobacter sp. Root690 TaxID=1736588 RepID=UPI0012FA3CCA|nr:hypothetical protein [Lysobacter sp. Root690]
MNDSFPFHRIATTQAIDLAIQRNLYARGHAMRDVFIGHRTAEDHLLINAAHQRIALIAVFNDGLARTAVDRMKTIFTSHAPRRMRTNESDHVLTFPNRCRELPRTSHFST